MLKPRVHRQTIPDLGELLFATEPERLIGLGRFIFAVAAYIAVYLDPTQPKGFVDETYRILELYVGFATLLNVLSFVRPLSASIRYLTHGVDILTITLLVHFTGGPTSPFHASFVFALLTGTIYWRWRGALLTVIILEIVLLALSWGSFDFADDTRSELNRFIVRSTFLIVAAAMLASFGAYRERSRDKLARLAAWPVELISDEGNPPVAGSLRHAAEVLGTNQIVVIWHDDEEPIARIACWDGSTCRFAQIPLLGVPSEDLAVINKVMRSNKVRGQGTIVDLIPESVLSPFAADLSNGYCASFQTTHYLGMVFVIRPQYFSEDVASMTEIVAARIAFELEQFALTTELAASASSRERVRLARDLHDSFLQDLTAANLKLATLKAGLPSKSRAMVDDVSGILVNQQRRLRDFIEETRSDKLPASQLLGQLLQTFADRLAKQWQCAISVAVEPPKLQVNRRLTAEIVQLISEATANAVRHGSADRLQVRAESINGRLQLQIQDNGRGWTGPTRASNEEGPRSLQTRVSDLGGSLDLQNSPKGVCLAIEIPLS